MCGGECGMQEKAVVAAKTYSREAYMVKAKKRKKKNEIITAGDNIITKRLLTSRWYVLQ